MATLVLTAVGTLIGGPIGGAIGGLLGNQLDQRLFGATVQRGPRLGDLSVQTSSYGQGIPKLFGSMRVAGSVIWATDLKETRSTSSTKGGPKTASYSYSASFAVVLSARPILGVGRIWADGKLLRGIEGDWKTETGYRLYVGDPDAAVDPLLAAAESGATPAYRDLAYAVFEDFQLADYGNRIPSLTFEVQADAGPVALGAVAAALVPGVVADATITTVAGYAASGDSLRGAVSALALLAPLSLRDTGAGLLLAEGLGTTVAIGETDLGTGAGDDRPPRRELATVAAGTLPDEVTLGYYEPLRDYQAGLQRARRDGPGRRVEAGEVAAALDADQAKAAAERRLAQGWAARRRLTLRLPWSRLDLAAGAAVTVDGLSGRWQVARRTLEKMVVTLELEGIAASTAIVPGATPGRVTGDPDLVHGPTVLALLDLPPLDDIAATAPRLHVAAAGPSAGWRRAALISTLDGGRSYATLGRTALPATIGSAVTALPNGETRLIDTLGSVDVQLLNATMWLAPADDDALVAGANLAMLGDELIQFGAAVPLAPGRFRLSRLLRGRRGTEWASGGHAAGDGFVLVERATLQPVDFPLGVIGGTLGVVAQGIGDTAAGVAAARRIEGRALAPPAPVGLSASLLADGAVAIGWTRRSRVGWAWIDGTDAPLGEDGERYRLTIEPDIGVPRSVDLAGPAFTWDAAMRAADSAAAATRLAIRVIQSGAYAESVAATLDLPLA